MWAREQEGGIAARGWVPAASQTLRRGRPGDGDGWHRSGRRGVSADRVRAMPFPGTARRKPRPTCRPAGRADSNQDLGLGVRTGREIETWEKCSCISITAEARGSEEASGNKQGVTKGEGVESRLERPGEPRERENTGTKTNSQEQAALQCQSVKSINSNFFLPK